MGNIIEAFHGFSLQREKKAGRVIKSLHNFAGRETYFRAE